MNKRQAEIRLPLSFFLTIYAVSGKVNYTPVWWNGRHRGLKIPWERSRAGSSPATGTKQMLIFHCEVLCEVSEKASIYAGFKEASFTSHFFPVE